jgi:hypothetical protein
MNPDFNPKIAPNTPDIQHILNLEGFLPTLTEEPTYVPRKFAEQIVIVTTGGSSRAYIYDTKAIGWKSVIIA